MDPISQGLLGGSLAGAFSKKNNINKAVFCGFIGGLAPDLDVLIKSSSDPLLSIDYHRHFTHSLIFSPIGGFLVSLIVFFIFKNKLPFKLIFLFSSLGYFSHGFLDACTSYGTILFWPFSDVRVGLNIISIIDPIFTLTLLIFFIFTLVFNSVFLIRTGLFLSMFLLIFNFFKYQQVESYVKNIAKERKHQIKKIFLNPTIGNNILWRSIYKHNNHYYIDAIYYPLFGKPKYKKGSKINVINEEKVFPSLPTNSTQRKDIKRFSYFSQGYIYIHPDHDNLIADLRYGTLPYDYKSLWGIEIDPYNPNNHVIFKNIRNFNESIYDEFWQMLRGDLN